MVELGTACSPRRIECLVTIDLSKSSCLCQSHMVRFSPLCHPTGKEYTLLAGDWLSIPVLAAHERKALLNIAASFNELEVEESKIYSAPLGKSKKQTSLRPGDEFNLRASWAEVLEPFGWTYQGRS